MKKLNLRKQYWAYAVLAAVCAGFIYTPQMAEAKFGKGETTSVFAKGNEATFLTKGWYVVGVDSGVDGNIITLFAKESWDQTSFGASFDYNSSNLKSILEGYYGTLVNDSTEKNAIKNTDFGYFYAPSAEELVNGGNVGQVDGGTFGLTVDGGLKLPNDTAGETKNYWTRSSGTDTDTVKVYNSDAGQLVQMGISWTFHVRPVIQVKQSIAGDTLRGGTETGSYFSSNAELSGNTFTSGTAGDIKYMIAKTTDATPTDIAAPVLATTGGLVLDGKNLTLEYSDVPTGFSVAAALIAETEGNWVTATTKFTNVGDNINVDYIAVVDGDGKVKFDGVNGGTYGLKIFGFNNNDSTVTGNHSATDLGNTMINQIKSDNNGLNLTIGSVNTGFTNITLANGAGVTLGADATSTDIGVADGTVSIALGAYKLKGVTIPASTVVKVTSSEGGFGAAITNNGTVDVKGSTTFNGFTNNGESSNLTITEAGTTTFTGAVANGGTANITSNNSTIFTGAVTNSKNMTVTSTNANNFNDILTNTGILNVNGSATFTGKVTNNGTDAKIIIANAGTTTFSDEISSNTGTIDITSANTIFNNTITNTGTIKITGVSEFKAVHNKGEIELNGDATFNLDLEEDGNLTIKSGTANFGTTNHVKNKVKIESGSLVVKASNLENVVTNAGTVKLGGDSDFVALNSAAKITGGAVIIGTNDTSAEKVSVAVSQFDNVSSINIGKNDDISKSDTLNITNVDADTTFATNITGGSLAVAGTADKVFTLSGTVDVQSISIDTATLQIPASLLLTGSVGSWNVITGKESFVAFSNNAGLNLDLNGDHYTLSDLNTIKNTGSLDDENVALVNGVLDLTGDEKLSTEADGSGVVSNATIAVHDASNGDKVADKISAAEKYVMVGKSDDNYQTPATLDAVTISQTPGTNNFVAKGLQIIPSGSSATFNVTSNSQVVLAGGTDNNGNISTPLVKAVLDGTDYKSEALDTKVVIDPTSTLQVGVDSGNATAQGMVINELALGGGGILNVKKTYLKVSNVTSSGGKIVIDPSYTENSDKTILNAETTLVQDGSVLNIGDMPVEKMKTAASEWGKSVTDTLGGGFTMNNGAMVGLGSAVAMPSSGKLWLTNNGSTHSEQVYFGADSMLVVNVPTAHAESDFNGGTLQGILYNVASLGSAAGASIYLDGALEESKYYVIVSGDATVGATIINGDGKQTVWDADHIYTSDATLELVPVADPEAMLGIDIGYFRNMIVLKATEGDILMSEPALNSYHPIMEKMVDAPASDDLNKMYADMKNVYRKNHKAGIDAMDSLMGLNSTSSMMRSGIVAANLMSQTTLDHVSLMERSSLNPNYGRSRYADGLRNTVAARDIFEPEYVDVGRSSAVMPVPSRQYTPSKQQNYIAKSYSGKSYSEKSYKAEAPKHYHSSYGSSYNDEDKKVWAEYIHSKETTDGMAVTGNGDNSTSGAVVGFDLWSGDHSFGGVSVAYSQTDVNNSASSTVTKNDIDTYGVGIYTRHDYSHCSMIFDAGYNYSKNDIKQEQNFGHNFEITGKPKVQIYDAGLRYEHSSHVSDKAAFVPYVGVRYTMVDPDSYCTNIGFKYKSKEKDIVSIPLGIRLSLNLYGNGFMVKPYLDFGYQWNFGQKDWKQTVMYDDVMSTLKYDVMDSNSHFINGGVQVYASNFNFGAGYRHSKSSHTKNNKWTINANWDL